MAPEPAWAPTVSAEATHRGSWDGAPAAVDRGADVGVGDPFGDRPAWADCLGVADAGDAGAAAVPVAVAAEELAAAPVAVGAFAAAAFAVVPVAVGAFAAAAFAVVPVAVVAFAAVRVAVVAFAAVTVVAAARPAVVLTAAFDTTDPDELLAALPAPLQALSATTTARPNIVTTPGPAARWAGRQQRHPARGCREPPGIS